MAGHAPPTHTRAAILSTGDELLIGQLLDANSRYLADQLTSRGIVPIEHATVGDDLPALIATIRRLAEAAPLLIMTGGLGPTDGDLTRTALARVLGESLTEDAASRAALESLFRSRGRPVSDRQLRQAQRPVSAISLANTRGTAPGLHAIARVAAAHGSTDIYCLPGPPGELRPMFQQQVLPRLRPEPGRIVITRLLHVIGIPEAEAADRVAALTARTCNPIVGITASGAVLTIRIRFEGASDQAAATAAIDHTEATVRAQLGASVFGAGDDTLHSRVLALLKERKRTIATVESCTGGLLGAMLSETAGSSAAFLGGWVTYSYQLKTTQVGVPESLLQEHGAVSEPVARAMALGGLDHSSADHCLAITGIAGPDGGTPAKPVGTVFIAHAVTDAASARAPSCHVRRFLFSGDREDIRTRAARSALAMAYFALIASPAPRLLWEQP